jgi:hypothetical protein
MYRVQVTVWDGFLIDECVTRESVNILREFQAKTGNWKDVLLITFLHLAPFLRRVTDLMDPIPCRSWSRVYLLGTYIDYTKGVASPTLLVSTT